MLSLFYYLRNGDAFRGARANRDLERPYAVRYALVRDEQNGVMVLSQQRETDHNKGKSRALH